MEIGKRYTCPNCAKKFTFCEENKPYRPFCTKRCKMIDLGQWFQEKYVIKGDEAAAHDLPDEKDED